VKPANKHYYGTPRKLQQWKRKSVNLAPKQKGREAWHQKLLRRLHCRVWLKFKLLLPLMSFHPSPLFPLLPLRLADQTQLERLFSLNIQHQAQLTALSLTHLVLAVGGSRLSLKSLFLAVCVCPAFVAWHSFVFAILVVFVSYFH